MENKFIYVINGPNLNLLGKRNPALYGSMTLEQLEKEIDEYASSKGYLCMFFQSNHEGDIIDYIQEASTNALGIIINAGAFTHYSYAIRDAIEYLDIPCIEVHLTNIKQRENFRKISVITEVCSNTIMGKLHYGYMEAVDCIDKIIHEDF